MCYCFNEKAAKQTKKSLNSQPKENNQTKTTKPKNPHPLFTCSCLLVLNCYHTLFYAINCFSKQHILLLWTKTCSSYNPTGKKSQLWKTIKYRHFILGEKVGFFATWGGGGVGLGWVFLVFIWIFSLFFSNVTFAVKWWNCWLGWWQPEQWLLSKKEHLLSPNFWNIKAETANRYFIFLKMAFQLPFLLVLFLLHKRKQKKGVFVTIPFSFFFSADERFLLCCV